MTEFTNMTKKQLVALVTEIHKEAKHMEVREKALEQQVAELQVSLEYTQGLLPTQ